MDYWILAEAYHTHIGKKRGEKPSWWPIGPERISMKETPMPYHFYSTQEAQNWMDKYKPADREWKIFYVENDDYANF